jgi:hypothetical protein
MALHIKLPVYNANTHTQTGMQIQACKEVLQLSEQSVLQEVMPCRTGCSRWLSYYLTSNGLFKYLGCDCYIMVYLSNGVGQSVQLTEPFRWCLQ